MSKKKKLFEVNDVSLGYDYWRKHLREKFYQMFNWYNLPSSLPSTEIMYRIVNRGYACIFRHSKYGIVTANGGLSGVDIYNHPTTFVYAQPKLGSGTLAIGKDCAIITAGSEFWFTRLRLQDTINRYAKLLADCESTLDIAVVNLRASRIFAAGDGSVGDELKRVMESLRNGWFDVVTEQQIVKTINAYETINGSQSIETADLLTLRDSIIKAFFAELGVNYTARKTERYLKDEISANDQMLNTNTRSIEESIKTGVARANEVLGTNILVEIAPEYDPRTYTALNDVQSTGQKGSDIDDSLS